MWTSCHRGIITVKDSNWLMSYTLNRQPHFKEQPKDQLVVWVYGLFTNVPGNYIKKPMRDCTGIEITEEWLFHMGVPESEIHEMATKSARSIPCMMPYVTAFFMPRAKGDRPKVVPEGCVNFAFVGQFSDTARDTVFTTEYSVRTAMEAVYTLLNVDRGVPEVFNSCYDIRVLLDSTSKMMDGKKMTDMKLPFMANLAKKKVLKKISGTVIEELLKKYNAI
ncbi:oleate hydratase [Aminipila terrae]|uniref:oleate hydratase n=1 Tax=Aminipila terrae TaxID=2697030 RepID=UPI002ED20676